MLARYRDRGSGSRNHTQAWYLAAVSPTKAQINHCLVVTGRDTSNWIVSAGGRWRNLKLFHSYFVETISFRARLSNFYIFITLTGTSKSEVLNFSADSANTSTNVIFFEILRIRKVININDILLEIFFLECTNQLSLSVQGYYFISPNFDICLLSASVTEAESDKSSSPVNN